MSAAAPALILRVMQSQADADAFRVLNEEWIERYFRLEEKDRRTLNAPQEQIVDRGGQVFVALQQEQHVGCVALLASEPGDFELSKMAVAPQMRGQGIGRLLLGYALDQARLLGAKRVFLGSNSVLANAVHLYESLGFCHVSPADLPHMGYARADVHMALSL